LRSSEVQNELLQYKADPNRKDVAGSSAILPFALARASDEVVQILLDAGADINDRSSGRTPLMNAALRASPAILVSLLRRGAVVNARSDNTGDRGHTALMFAAGAGRPESVRALLANHAEIDAQDTAGNTALLQAAEHCVDPSWAAGWAAEGLDACGAAAALAAGGADPDLTNHQGVSALARSGDEGHRAAACGQRRSWRIQPRSQSAWRGGSVTPAMPAM
jgi:ankyrin repeat protein